MRKRIVYLLKRVMHLDIQVMLTCYITINLNTSMLEKVAEHRDGVKIVFSFFGHTNTVYVYSELCVYSKFELSNLGLDIEYQLRIEN